MPPDGRLLEDMAMAQVEATTEQAHRGGRGDGVRRPGRLQGHPRDSSCPSTSASTRCARAATASTLVHWKLRPHQQARPGLPAGRHRAHRRAARGEDRNSSMVTTWIVTPAGRGPSSRPSSPPCGTAPAASAASSSAPSRPRASPASTTRSGEPRRRSGEPAGGVTPVHPPAGSPSGGSCIRRPACPARRTGVPLPAAPANGLLRPAGRAVRLRRADVRLLSPTAHH